MRPSRQPAEAPVGAEPPQQHHRQRLRPASAYPAIISTGRPTSPGMPRAISTWPTATAIRASPNSTKTASTSSAGARAAPRPDSSTCCTRLPLTRRATSTWPTGKTAAFRCSTATALSRRSSSTSALPGPSASRPGRTSTCTRPIRITRTTLTTAKFTRWSWTEKSWANSAGPASCSRSLARCTKSIAATRMILYVGEITTWRVQKLTLKPTATQTSSR